jgi:hypothetical protein
MGTPFCRLVGAISHKVISPQFDEDGQLVEISPKEGLSNPESHEPRSTAFASALGGHVLEHVLGPRDMVGPHEYFDPRTAALTRVVSSLASL